VIRKRKYHGHKLSIYWIGRIDNGRFVPYSDVLGPTGYGHQNREVAKKIMREIEERIEVNNA
jgi:glutamate-1-semialdehyde aminotransferase